ncbi:MAG: hypothetical protein CBB66_00645 [bacterium TMED6]|nr:MAG: hypothetical protein CBB66_00645 [bacterium TMED6]
MKIFNIRNNEKSSIVYGFFYSFFIVSFFIVSKSYRDSLFLNSFGKEELSVLYIVTPLIIGLSVWFITFILDKIDLFKKGIIIHVIIFIISILSLTNINSTTILFYYVFVDFQIAMIAFLFWRSLSSTFSTRQAKRLYGVITSGGFLSAILLGSSLSILTQYISQKDFLILFNFLILFCPLFIKQLTTKSFSGKTKIENKKKSDESVLKLIQNKYVLNIISIIFLFTIISVFIDYYFKLSSYDKFSNNPDQLTNYFTQFYSIASLLSFLVQIFVSSYIFKRFGIAYTLLILPMLLLLLSPFSIIVSSYVIIFLLKGNEQIFKSTLHDTSMQILWMPLPSYIKDPIKPLVNILFKNIFSSFGGLLIILTIYFELQFINIIPVLICLLLFLIFIMMNSKTYYINELVRAIDDRSLSFENKNSINFSNNIEMLDIVNKKIIDDKKDRYFILKLLDKNIIEKCKITLIEVFYESDIKTQKEILKYFYDDEESIKSDYLINQVKSNNELSADCLNILFKRDNKEVRLLNEDLCQSRSPILKYAAINNSLQYKIGNKTEIINQLYERLNNLEDCNYIIKYINTDFLNLDTKQFIKISSSLDYELLIKALKFIKVYDDKYLWDSIVDNCFKQSYIDPKLISFLQNAEQIELFTFFKLKLLNKNYLIEKKLFINELALQINHDKSIILYNDYFKKSLKDDYTFDRICDSIIEIKSKNNDDKIDNRLIERLIDELNSSLYLYIRLSFLIDRDSEERRIIEEYFKYRINKKTKILVKLLYYNNEELFKKNLNLNLFSNELYLHKVIEIFEESLTKKYKDKIIPILDDISLLDKNNYSLKFYKYLKTVDINHLVETKMLGEDQWYDFISSFEVFNNNTDLFTELMSNNKYFNLLIKNTDYNKENFLKIDNIKLILEQMITSLEKTLYLKDSSIFKDIPAKELIFISQELEEIQYSDNTVIFKDGEVGDSMYFIFNGEIRISKGDNELVCLKRGDYFGEMALLDGEPRSADATTITNSVLLKLNSNKFKNVLYSNQHVVKGVLSMLCDRLRNANNIINK